MNSVVRNHCLDYMVCCVCVCVMYVYVYVYSINVM